MVASYIKRKRRAAEKARAEKKGLLRTPDGSSRTARLRSRPARLLDPRTIDNKIFQTSWWADDLRYYTTIGNTLWIKNPKCASTSVAHGLGILPRNKSYITDPHRLDEIDFSSLTNALMVVRNPYDRLLSCYRDRIKQRGMKGYKSYRNKSFGDFVDIVCEKTDEYADQHFRSQHTFLAGLPPHVNIYIFYTESLNREWGNFVDLLDLSPLGEKEQKRIKSRISPRLGQHKRSRNSRNRKKPSDRQVYQNNPELVKKVKQRYNRDLELFEYSF